MSRILVQPVGQKRLTNVAVVRLKSHGMRFEIACFKNKVLSWRSKVIYPRMGVSSPLFHSCLPHTCNVSLWNNGVSVLKRFTVVLVERGSSANYQREKDIDEVLQSHTVYTNVSKGVLAKSKDLIAAFGTDDQDKICLEILEKGELQVSGREREVHLTSQFRDIATIVMQKTVNPQTERPYTISMIERLMREVHFALEPNKSSKKQALELIKELESRFPIVRAKMRLQLFVPNNQGPMLTQKLEEWGSFVEQSDGLNSILKVVCQLDPGHFRECDAFVKDLNGKLEVISMAVHKEGDGNVDELLDDAPSKPSSLIKNNVGIVSQIMSSRTSDLLDLSTSVSHLSLEKGTPSAPLRKEKQRRCTTCDTEVGDASQHREHFKSDWHKHNLKRKVKQLPPLSAEEWHLDTEILDEVNDLKDYSR